MRIMLSTRDKTIELLSAATRQTVLLGEQLGSHLQAGDVLCLEGDLGTGKTHLAQGVARGWGITQQVTSPTFTLLKEYQRPSDSLRFYHLDCYRLQDAQEAWALGLDDVLNDTEGVLVVEWPQRITAALPVERLWITLRREGEGRRHLTFYAHGERYLTLLSNFAESTAHHVAGD